MLRRLDFYLGDDWLSLKSFESIDFFLILMKLMVTECEGKRETKFPFPYLSEWLNGLLKVSIYHW